MTNLTEEQVRQEIITTFDKNFLVEAGAGAGKSTLIVERIVNQLSQEKPLKLSEIVAITFTEKAAGELQMRIQKKLKEKMHENPDYFTDLYRNVDQLFVGTIHSFCAKLLQEAPFNAGLTIGFQQMDNVEDELFKMQVWQDYILAEKTAEEQVVQVLNRKGKRNDRI